MEEVVIDDDDEGRDRFNFPTNQLNILMQYVEITVKFRDYVVLSRPLALIVCNSYPDSLSDR